MNENDRFKAGLSRTESPAASLRSALGGAPAASSLHALRPQAAPVANRLSGLRPITPLAPPRPALNAAASIKAFDPVPVIQQEVVKEVAKEVKKQVKVEVATQLNSVKLRADLGEKAPDAGRMASLRSQIAGTAPGGVLSAELRKDLTPVSEQSGLFQSIAPLAKVIPVTQQQKLGILSKQLGVFKGSPVSGVSKNLGLKF